MPCVDFLCPITSIVSLHDQSADPGPSKRAESVLIIPESDSPLPGDQELINEVALLKRELETKNQVRFIFCG